MAPLNNTSPQNTSLREEVAPLEDGALLCDYAQQGSDDAFAAIVSRHVGLVYSAALRQVSGNAAAAQDVTQMVFFDLARQAGRLVRHPTLIGWLYTTTRRHAARAVRDETRRQMREQKSHTMQELLCGQESEEELDWRLLRPVLDAAMHDLSETDRLAILLRHFEQHSLRDVGAKLGISENSARMRVDRALDRLRLGLEKRDVTSSASALAAALAGQAVKAAPAMIASSATAAAIFASAPFDFALFSVMISIKFKIAVVVAAALAFLAPLTLQHFANQGLRSENDALKRQFSTTLDQLRMTEENAAVTITQLTDLRAENIELLRLRREVAKLRQLTVDKPLNRTSAGLIPNEASRSAFALEDLGNDTPENAATTALWAISEGIQSRFKELVITSDKLPLPIANQIDEVFFRNMTRNYAGKQFTSVSQIRTNEHSSVTVDFGFRDLKTGDTDPFSLAGRKAGWSDKLAVNPIFQPEAKTGRDRQNPFFRPL